MRPTFIPILCSALMVFTYITEGIAKPSTSTKFSVIRTDSADQGKQTLILPYAFASDSMGQHSE